MKTSLIILSLLLSVSASARLLGTQTTHKRGIYRTHTKREVPQEHSHEKFLTAVGTALNLDNPDNIADPVFGLLGNAAAITGAGDIADPDCLQQATADQAFTNAKAAGDVDGMTAALVYRTLERNTGSVGLKSVLCTSITPVNKEIAALTQHQDPASAGAAAENKAIALELAVQIASIGGDPTVALQSGTFEPGQIGDPTGAGNTCDDLDDPEGCIFTKNLLVEDATEEEIAAAVEAAGGAGAGASAEDTATATATASAADDATATATATAVADDEVAATTTAAAGAAETSAAVAVGADTEEVLQEVEIDATTSIKIVKVTKGAAADAAAGADDAATPIKKKGKKKNNNNNN